MTETQVTQIKVGEEVEKFFDDTSISSSVAPEIVLIMGGVAVGKTTHRKRSYSSGYVVIDSAEVFLSLCRGGYFDFPGPFEELMEIIGQLIAERAVSEQRNIVTEIIGSEYEPTVALIEAMKGAGYKVNVVGLKCDLEESMKRNLNRGDDCISAYYADAYQIRWLFGAVSNANT